MKNLNPLLATFLIFGNLGNLGNPFPAIAQDGAKQMVMVDRATLTSTQSSTLDNLIPQLPRTSVGKRCRFYGKPAVWCLLLDGNQANQVKNRLVQAGVPAEVREVRRIREARGAR